MKNTVLALASLALLAPIAVMPNIHEVRQDPTFTFQTAFDTPANRSAANAAARRLFAQYDLYYSLYPEAK